MTTAATNFTGNPTDGESSRLGGKSAAFGIALAAFALHLFFNKGYGYFRDEFDYIICGRHLAWGYVDQPPVVPVLSRIFLAIFGESLRAVRLMPSLCASGLIVLTGAITRLLGGRRFAVVLSAITVLIAPIFISGGSLLTANCDLEPLLWMGCVYFAILAVRQPGDSPSAGPRNWLWFGIVAGIGLEEKYSIAVPGFAIVVGLLLTAERRALWSKWMWVGGLAALLIFLPNLLWNIANHWPFVQLMHNISVDGRNVTLSPWEYFTQQALLIFPLSAPLWITGVIAFFFAPRFKMYRFLAWAYLAAFAVFVALKGKSYYLAPIYPVYLAAGSVVVDDAIDRVRQTWLKPAIVAVLLLTGAMLAPLAMPILPIDQFISYMNWLPIKVPRNEHSHMRAALPQHYADQFGWNEIAQKTAEAWSRIPESERRDCGIIAQDYGQAGAIDFLGPKHGLPPALSGHQSWWLWGPRGYSGNCLIVLDDDQETLEGLFEHVELVGRTPDNPYALERELTVYICRGAKFGSLEQMWPRMRKWR